MRKYLNHSPHEILTDVAITGKSSGWSGSLQELESFKKFLEPFNVVYVDDFHGTWKRRPTISENLIKFSETFPSIAQNMGDKMQQHAEVLSKLNDPAASSTFVDVCEGYKQLAESIRLLVSIK